MKPAGPRLQTVLAHEALDFFVVDGHPPPPQGRAHAPPPVAGIYVLLASNSDSTPPGKSTAQSEDAGDPEQLPGAVCWCRREVTAVNEAARAQPER